MTVKQLKPMLALSEIPNLYTEVTYPKMASKKLDGFRCLIVDGVPKTRKLLDIPNDFVAGLLRGLPAGLDGELIVGDPTHHKVFSNTAKGIGKKTGQPDFTFWVFDDFSLSGTFRVRHAAAAEQVAKLNLPYVRIVEQVRVETPDAANDLFERWYAEGYEGAILRDPAGPYKYGRSTLNEQWMLKAKKWVDSEGEILSCHEQLTNTNEAQVDELGHTKRSTAKAGKVPNGTLGACKVRWNNGREIVEFSLAAGGTNEEVAELWAQRDTLPGQMVTFKYVGVGVNGRPRHPIWKSLRPKFDV